MPGAMSRFIWAICMSLFVIEIAQKRWIRNLGTEEATEEEIWADGDEGCRGALSN